MTHFSVIQSASQWYDMTRTLIAFWLAGVVAAEWKVLHKLYVARVTTGSCWSGRKQLKKMQTRFFAPTLSLCFACCCEAPSVVAGGSQLMSGLTREIQLRTFAPTTQLRNVEREWARDCAVRVDDETAIVLLHLGAAVRRPGRGLVSSHSNVYARNT